MVLWVLWHLNELNHANLDDPMVPPSKKVIFLKFSMSSTQIESGQNTVSTVYLGIYKNNKEKAYKNNYTVVSI